MGSLMKAVIASRLATVSKKQKKRNRTFSPPTEASEWQRHVRTAETGSSSDTKSNFENRAMEPNSTAESRASFDAVPAVERVV